MKTGWKPRCGTWKTCPKVIPATSFTASFSARSYWKRPVWFSFAQQQYRMLFRTGLHMMLSEWEPSLLKALEQKLTAEQ